jgi:hypothetical protein
MSHTTRTAPLPAVGYLNALRARGVRLERDPTAVSGVTVAGPPDALTPQVVARIQQALPHLLPHLERYAALVRLGAEVEAQIAAEEESWAVLEDPVLVWLRKTLARTDALREQYGPHWWRDTARRR